MSSKKMAVVDHLRTAFDNGKVTSRDEITDGIFKLDKGGLQLLSSHLGIKFTTKTTKPNLIKEIMKRVILLEEVDRSENTLQPVEIDPRFFRVEKWKNTIAVWKGKALKNDHEDRLNLNANLETWRPGILAIAENELRDRFSIKLHLSVKVNYEKESDEGEITIASKYFNSKSLEFHEGELFDKESPENPEESIRSGSRQI